MTIDPKNMRSLMEASLPTEVAEAGFDGRPKNAKLNSRKEMGTDSFGNAMHATIPSAQAKKDFNGRVQAMLYANRGSNVVVAEIVPAESNPTADNQGEWVAYYHERILSPKEETFPTLARALLGAKKAWNYSIKDEYDERNYGRPGYKSGSIFNKR